MAHHRSTPQAVLDAPVAHRHTIHASPGLNRAERRHPVDVPLARKFATFGQTNTPFVGRTSDLYPER